MNTPLFPVAIYASQLNAFKAKAELLSSSISEALSIKKLSAFKRNDYLSIALGYKGHPDLLQSTKFRKDSDTGKQLLIFSNEAIRQSITKVFCEKLNLTNTEIVLECCDNLGYIESIDSIPATDISDLKYSIEDDKNAITGNTYSNAFMYLDELDNSPKAIIERQSLAKFLTEQEVKNSPKSSSINIVIDLSEIPSALSNVIYEHQQLLKLQHKVVLEARSHNVEFKILEPKTTFGKNEQWKIRASIDTWSKIDPTSNILNIWNEFKVWLLSFYSTDRIYVSERINSHRMSVSTIQFSADNPIEHQLSKLSKIEDTHLFSLLAEQKGKYSHIF